MIYTIAETLSQSIKALDCVDRWGGLTTPITMQDFDNDGNLIKTNTFPASCYVDSGYDDWAAGTPYDYEDKVKHNGVAYNAILINADKEPPNATYWEVLTILDEQDCTDISKVRRVILDSKFKSVLFFEDNSGAQWSRIESPRGRIYVFNFNIRLIAWLNLAELGGAGCNYAGTFALHLISLLYGTHDALPEALSNSTDIAPLASVEVKQVNQLPKSINIFSKYTYTKEKEQGLFIYPYDYFALDLRGEFKINSSCISAFTCAAGIDCPEL